MISFEKVYELVEKSSHETAFNYGECFTLYNLCKKLTSDSVVVEIGLQFGRSATVIGCLAKEIGFRFFGIDNWKERESEKAKAHFEQVLIEDLELPIRMIEGDSKEVWKFLLPILRNKIDLLHIDGDHSYTGVMEDLMNFGTWIKSGGYLCLDDFTPVYPAVQFAIHDFMADRDMDFNSQGVHGDKLVVFQKV